ncbi:MAG: CARDB domain-containing protein, partial [Flavobacteriaceae bacterium]|nr:CARDB domain-containing protein [Flavobacteriaceae bacterium]
MKFIPINQLVSVLYYFKKYLIGLLFLITPLLVSAQDVTLFEQFNGRYDFTAIGNTLNVGPNSCNILTQSSANLTLTANQDLVAARLYWAGSGGTPFDNNPGDYQVTLNGTNVNAQRTFLNDDIGIPYFGASADVTAIVLANGNGNYTLSNLDLTGNIGSYCGNGTDFGGWSIVVVYEDEDNLALNQISLFDGFEIVSGGTPDITITLGPLDVASDLLAKIGFLAWEGDAGLNNGENLIINGTQISDPPLNPANNQFNGTNSYTGSSELWNMDLDVYNLEGLVDPGDTEIIIDVGSDQDLVIIHNIITSVNSELPDASIIFEPIEFICNNTVDLNYTVFNVNSTGELPAGVPIKFYLEGAQIAQAVTTTTLPINGAETGTVTLTIPTGTVPDPFTILAVVDDDGGGVSTVTETNEDNNEF